MLKIVKIASIETYSIRISVLRKGKNIDLCPFEGDNLPTTIHLGAVFDNNLVGIVSIFKVQNDLFDFENQFQIRGMAVLETNQKQGIGKFLVDKAEMICKNENGNLIWMNARKKAVQFYKKLGYSIVGKAFEIEEIGTHYKMIKQL